MYLWSFGVPFWQIYKSYLKDSWTVEFFLKGVGQNQFKSFVKFTVKGHRKTLLEDLLVGSIEMVYPEVNIMTYYVPLSTRWLQITIYIVRQDEFLFFKILIFSKSSVSMKVLNSPDGIFFDKENFFLQ